MTKSRDDKDDKQTSHDPSRRKFLKGVGIAGAGAAVVDKLWIDVEAKETQADTSQSMSGSCQSHSRRQRHEADSPGRTTHDLTKHVAQSCRPGSDRTQARL